jgi:hypothetical protein
LKFKRVLLFLLLVSVPAHALDYHGVGWFNTFIPGGGAALMGHGWQATQEAGIELGTFVTGYSLSARSDLTIDGTPQDYPAVQTNLGTTPQSTVSCPTSDPITHAPICHTVSKNKNYYTSNGTPSDLLVPSAAAFLQEIGLKYHMVNVFDSYREAYRSFGGGDPGQGIDPHTTKELFMSPFDPEVLERFEVWGAIAGVLAITAVDYGSQVSGGISPIQKLTSFTNVAIGFNQMALYPVGSGAPEEMFYRGFLQNEAYHLVPSPLFSIPVSALAFSFSHGPEGRGGALVSGTYLGILAHTNHGDLTPGIAVHFWSVFILGIESFLLTQRAQNYQAGGPPPVSAKFDFTF